MPDLEQMLAEAQDSQKRKKFSRGLRPDHLTREPVSPSLPAENAKANLAIEKSATADHAEPNAMVKSTTAKLAIAEITQATPAIANFAVAKDAIEDPAIADIAIPNAVASTAANAQSAIALSATPTLRTAPASIASMVNAAIAKSASGAVEDDEGSSRKSTQVEYVTAKTTIAALADKKHGYTRVDNYVFDSLLPSIQNPAAALLYLYLWRRTIGFQKTSVELSHQILSDAVGISKRTVQEAIALLNDKGLVKTTRTYSTAIPRHTVQKPWLVGEEYSDAVAETATAEVAIEIPATAEIARSYSENCQPAIAEIATTKRKVLNKENKSLSLPELFTQRLSALTESQAKRERESFDKLTRQYPGEDMEIAETLHYLASTGTDLAGAPLRSPMGLLLTNYPQIRDYLRERNAAKAGAEVRKQHHEQQKAQELAQEQLDAALYQKRQEAFLGTFSTEEAQQLAVEEWTRAAPWIKDKQGALARHFAINAWGSQQQNEQ